MIRTLVVDDQRLVRAGLRMLCAAADGIAAKPFTPLPRARRMRNVST